MFLRESMPALFSRVPTRRDTPVAQRTIEINNGGFRP